MASAMGFNLVAALRLVRSTEQTLQGNSIVEPSCLPVCDQWTSPLKKPRSGARLKPTAPAVGNRAVH